MSWVQKLDFGLVSGVDEMNVHTVESLARLPGEIGV